MAFANRFGNILRQTVSKHVKSDLLASCPSLYQAIRCMSSSKVFVGGLSYSTDDTSLREAFANYGSVIEARIIMDRETGRSRGFGFVSFTSGEEASAAIAALDGKDLHGRMIRVNYATDRTGGFRSGGGGYGNASYGGGNGGYGGNGGGSYGGGGDGYNGGGYNSGGNYRGDGFGGTSTDGYGGGSSGGSYGGSFEGGNGGYGGSFEGGNGGYGGAPTAGGYGSGATGGFGSDTFGGNGGSFGAPPSTGNCGDIYNGSSGNFAGHGNGQGNLSNQAFGNDGQDANQAGFRHMDDGPKNYANGQA